MSDGINSNNISRLLKGLHRDSALKDQPKDTLTFALNATIESLDGDFNFYSNEESNKECYKLPQDYIIIGEQYITENNFIIFLSNPVTNNSQIGLLDNNCNYKVLVDDSQQESKLKFKVENQIDSVYRLRRGCERTVYFVEKGNKPRIIDIDNLKDYKNDLNEWDISRFNLFKTYISIPIFDEILIEETGALKSGSYNFSIQYLDEDFNPTEWITTSDTIIIYNDSITSKSFAEIRGSTNEVNFYQNFGNTSKAIKVSFSNLDTNYPFYRIAIIEANNGSGRISGVKISSEISTKVVDYLYTGENAVEETTVEEIQLFNNVIQNAEHIEQLENRLILGNTEGVDTNFCRLQKFASKIKSDLVLKEVTLNNITSKNNQKDGTLHTNSIGYMPGEIYSFGIVYVFKDFTLSPVFHIPGRNSKYNSQMSLDNGLSNSFYTDDSNCTEESYWGFDSENEKLLETNIRHHRFPLRSEIGEPLYYKENVEETITLFKNTGLYLEIKGTLTATDSIDYYVSYVVSGKVFEKTGPYNIDQFDYDSNVGIEKFLIDSVSSELEGAISLLKIYERNKDTGLDEEVVDNVGPISGLTYYDTIEEVENDKSNYEDNSVYKTKIYGIEFSNIDLPTLNDSSDNPIVGYYIVRNERTETNKTVLDTAVILPLIVEQRNGVDKFVGHGHLLPHTSRLKDDVFALIHPEFKFNNREYQSTTQFVQEGEYSVNGVFVNTKTLQDVQPGTSYDSSAHRRRERDSDGYSFQALIRGYVVSITNKFRVFANSFEIKEIFYLDTLFGKNVTDIDDKKKQVYNLSADNKIGILQLNKRYNFLTDSFKDKAGNNTSNSFLNIQFLNLFGFNRTIGYLFNLNASKDYKIPYLIMKRDLSTSYSNFRSLPYYRETTNYFSFTSDTNNSATIFNGDSYISSMKYFSSMFYDIRMRKRRGKSSVLNFVLGVLSTIAGAVLTLTGIGASAGVALISFGIGQIQAGLQKEQLKRVYQDLYEQGLKDTVEDSVTDTFFGPNPEDDTIQWFYDSISDLWFESGVNMNWRMGSNVGITDFLPSPTGYNSESMLQYAIDKTTRIDSENSDGRGYQGFATPELYLLNKDYTRRSKEKIYYHLPIEYDCCSDCLEQFPHRWHWSEQSFQEELTDNYRVFLPNNYKDLEGDTGPITNIFKQNNDFFIHTSEGIYNVPRNYQERVTDQIVSFIGTGSYFDVPPQKLIDDNTNNSAGSIHKWATVKTPNGVFFISSNQGVVYNLTGNGLQPISVMGMYTWFKNNIPSNLNKEYYNINNEDYPYNNNPSNKYGIGFIATYDSRKERVLFTKKDFLFDNIASSDYRISLKDGGIVVFDNFTDRVEARRLQGWSYVGISNNRLKFEKYVTNINTLLVEYEDGVYIENPEQYNYSWTISYSLKTKVGQPFWTSFHSYTPNVYISSSNNLYSFITNSNIIWKHNVIGSYQKFYNKLEPFIIEYVSLSNPIVTKIFDAIRYTSEAYTYNTDTESYKDERFVTFNKGMFYNSRQNTGMLDLMVKDLSDQNYMYNQVKGLSNDTIIIDKNEKDWFINNLRDNVIDTEKPMFTTNIKDLQNTYYTDKAINNSVIDYNKDWTQLESFRDKYFVIRLIFDTFDNTKLVFNYSVEAEVSSHR